MGTESFFRNFKIPIKTGGAEQNQNEQSIEFSSPLSGINAELGQSETNSNPPETRLEKQKAIEQENEITRKRKAETCTKISDVMFFGRDKEYPSELNALILPLSCTLCKINCNSLAMARSHYASKNHLKHVRNWLTEWSTKNGVLPPKLPKVSSDLPVGPNAFHCEACDLPLTSQQHATQHYNGKRHKMVISNRSDPAGSGYYDSTGKWVRTHSKIILDNRFGIGAAHLNPEIITPLAPPPPPPPPGVDDFVADVAQPLNPVPPPPPPTVPIIPDTHTSLYCNVCKIFVTSAGQMDAHLRGSKHAKKLKAAQLPPHALPSDTILNTVSKPPPMTPTGPDNDSSMYRTPSGSFYCKTCNTAVVEEAIFMQHLASRKHVKAKASENK